MTEEQKKSLHLSRFCEALFMVYLPNWWEVFETPYKAFENLDPKRASQVLLLANWPDALGMPRPGVGENEPFWKLINE